MQQVLWIGKVGTAATWLWALAGALGLNVPQATFGPLVLLSLVVAHGVQIPMFMPKLQDEGHHLKHAIGLLIFGVFYYYSKHPEALGQSNRDA